MDIDLISNPDKNLESALQKELTRGPISQVPMGLFAKILNRLELEKERLALRNLKLKLWGSFAGMILTVTVLVLAFNFSVKAFINTGSLQFLSLLFTDFKTVADNWQDYAFSILENLPLAAAVISLSAVLAVILVGEYISGQWQNFRKILFSRKI